MQLGASIAVGDIGAGPTVMRDYAQAAEGLGFDYLVAPDHVLGVDPGQDRAGPARLERHRLSRSLRAVRLPGRRHAEDRLRRRRADPGAAPGGAGRQAGGLARCLCEGRFRLGVGVGWNEIEFQGLGMDFHTRGVRSAEQVRFMQALWAKERRHLQGQVSRADRRRHQPAAEVGQGAGVVRRPCRADPEARGQVRRRLHAQPLAAGRRGAQALRAAARHDQEAGRKPEDVGLEVWVSPGKGTRTTGARRSPSGRRRVAAMCWPTRPSPVSDPRAHQGQELRRPPEGAIHALPRRREGPAAKFIAAPLRQQHLPRSRGRRPHGASWPRRRASTRSSPSTTSCSRTTTPRSIPTRRAAGCRAGRAARCPIR